MSGGADAGERTTPTPVHAAGRLCLLVFLMAAYGLVKMQLPDFVVEGWQERISGKL